MQMWANLKDMPKKMLANIVNQRILKMDQEACENLLTSMLTEKIA